MGSTHTILRGGYSSGAFIDNIPSGESHDAYKLIGSGNTLINAITHDLINRTEGHCDDVQIIPKQHGTNSQFFGAISYNNTIIGGALDSDGSMQGIFASDGGHVGLIIHDRIITTRSEHKVSISGALTDCSFRNIKDKNGTNARILLDNMRFGGGAPGNFYVLSFKDHLYGEIDANQPLDDRRGKAWRKNAEYIENFDLDLFRRISESTHYESVEQHLADCRTKYDRATQTNTMKVAITAGHNAVSQGVRRNGTTEFKFAKKIIPEVLARITHIEGIEVREFERKYQGSRTYPKEMRELHSRIDKWGAEVDIELHFNAFPRESAKGHEVVYFTRSSGGRKVAAVLDRAYDKHLDNRDRNLKKVGKGERGSYGLRIGNSISIIGEPCFAKELNEFKEGGSQRENLIKAYVAFFENIADALR